MFMSLYLSRSLTMAHSWVVTFLSSAPRPPMVACTAATDTWVAGALLFSSGVDKDCLLDQSLLRRPEISHSASAFVLLCLSLHCSVLASPAKLV